MSNQQLGINSHFTAGFTEGAQIPFTGVASGVEAITAGYAQDTAAVAGGRGVTASQLAPWENYDFAFNCRSNAVLDAVMRESFGARWYCTWAPEGRLVGQSGNTFEAVIQPVLTFGWESDVVFWGNTIMVDGVPVAAPLSVEIPRPFDAPKSYLTSQCDFYFGNEDGLVALQTNDRASLQSDLVLTSANVLSEVKAKLVAGVNGMARDVIEVGFSVGVTVLIDDETAKLATLREGVFVIRRRDANYGYAIPASLDTRPLESPSQGVNTLALNFTQSVPGVPVGGVPVTAGNNLDATAAQPGYVVDPTALSVTAVIAATPITGDAFGIHGVPILGEGVR